ncbi:MAG: hypothetical protein K0S41_2981 [Anaerocolumna sp.]|jgi:hypothetical protein|nr:hypothetical protein [Anaerocolumna sp.]
MEKYAKKVKVRSFIMSIVTLLIGITIIFLMIIQKQLPNVPDFIRGFQFGAFSGLELIMIYYIVKDIISINDEKSLRKLYIKETDERTKAIMQQTGDIGMTICMIGLAFATIVAGFFDQTVFFSLLGATIFTSTIRGVLKLYYHKKL